MGGGRNDNEDVAKGPPRDPLSLVLGAPQADGGAGQAYAFCDEPHRFPFRAIEGSDPASGTAVLLKLADPPRVEADHELIGFIIGHAVAAVRGCLELGYTVHGVVDSFDAGTREGTVDVQGERRSVA